ncbi:hypothetical protein N7541_009603 [Penicillium brevicompactum]|uniref:Transcription factor domain-containing protein n=1 Tax=Penicillium brevicompactum TaxID=5074 RepID=A0A9W9QPD1_PENBR|nr:hypothetical protein N7541_009603 [Penicillium brevicompactum]
MAKAAGKLPPIGQARELFNHFTNALQPSLGLLHIPSTRLLMEQTYQEMLDGRQPSPTTLMLLFSVFSGAALVWSTSLLKRLSATQTEARSALHAYSQTALFILEHPTQPIQSSTNAIVAICALAHSLANDAGLSVTMRILQARGFSMARDLQIHRLDTARSQEERKLKGCDLIDIEVRRRVWWNMVASDWLSAFSGGPHEGVYIFQPKHMNVNYPSNIDDQLMMATGVQQDFPLSVPTAMSGCIQRIRTAALCREVVDALPSMLLDSQQPDYEVILALDKRFQDTIEKIPDFFKMDEESIRNSQDICRERPYITWLRISLHFSFHTRLCRLHRPYHLKGTTDPRYHYSNRVCIRSAQTVLELRRAMDEIGPEAGGYPARLWRVVQHVFFAALILATDVSFNPDAPDADIHKAKVLAAYQTLERSKEESGTLFEGVHRNMQTLLSTLKQRPGTSDLQGSLGEHSAMAPRETERDGTLMGSGELPGTNDLEGRLTPTTVQETSASGGLTDNLEENWQQIWSDFVAVAPDLDVPQWSSLLDDVDFGWMNL